ncbi:unnamed protein product [Closterium sp. NIES-53]
MEALSDFSSYLTRGVQRRAELLVAYKVEQKLDAYIPDGLSYTDAMKMQISLYIAKGYVAPYFPPEDPEEEAREAEEEARTRLEEEKRRQQEEGQESSGFWSLFSWDDGEEEEQVKEEKEAESYLMSFFDGKVVRCVGDGLGWGCMASGGHEVMPHLSSHCGLADHTVMSLDEDEKPEEAKAEAERIAVARYAQKKAEAEDAGKEEEEEQGVLATISNYFSSS